jgi:hypothetical protein
MYFQHSECSFKITDVWFEGSLTENYKQVLVVIDYIFTENSCTSHLEVVLEMLCIEYKFIIYFLPHFILWEHLGREEV